MLTEVGYCLWELHRKFQKMIPWGNTWTRKISILQYERWKIILSFPIRSIVEKIDVVSKNLSTLACTSSMWELQIYIRRGNLESFNQQLKVKVFLTPVTKMPRLTSKNESILELWYLECDVRMGASSWMVCISLLTKPVQDREC